MVDKRELHRTLETMEKFHYRVLMNVYDHMIPDRSGHFKELLSELFQEGSLILSFKGEDKEYMDDLGRPHVSGNTAEGNRLRTAGA